MQRNTVADPNNNNDILQPNPCRIMNKNRRCDSCDLSVMTIHSRIQRSERVADVTPCVHLLPCLILPRCIGQLSLLKLFDTRISATSSRCASQSLAIQSTRTQQTLHVPWLLFFYDKFRLFFSTVIRYRVQAHKWKIVTQQTSP